MRVLLQSAIAYLGKAEHPLDDPDRMWLVANHLKHGMMTVRSAGQSYTMQNHGTNAGARDTLQVAHDATMAAKSAPPPPVPVMALLSFVVLAAGFVIARLFSA